MSTILNKRVLLFAFGLIAAALFIVWLNVDVGDVWAHVVVWLGQGHHVLSQIPWWLFWIAFALLPLVGMPLSLFYVLAAPVAGNQWGGLAMAATAVFINQALSYWLASGPLHAIASWFLQRWHVKIPTLPAGREGQFILLVRFSPLPFAAQNYSLGLTRCGFRTYMLYSYAPQMLIGSGVVILGSSILNGGLGAAMLGLFLILAVSLGAQAWIKRNRNVAVTTPPEA